jgi:hypothetical protein
LAPKQTSRRKADTAEQNKANQDQKKRRRFSAAFFFLIHAGLTSSPWEYHVIIHLFGGFVKSKTTHFLIEWY